MTPIGTMKLFAPALASVSIVIAAGPAHQQQEPATAQAPAGLARDVIGPAATLDVTSPDFENGEPIPARFSDFGEKISPTLAWSGDPTGTRSFTIIVDDPDAKPPAPSPYVHWMLYNLPAPYSSLWEGVPNGPQLVDLGNARQGKNSHGTLGYFGPRPPAADPAHHYHFQVFAMDSVLNLLPGVDRAELLSAMKGHVLAHGGIVGTFTTPAGAR